MSKDRGEALIARSDTELLAAHTQGGQLLGPGNLPRLLCRLLRGGGCALEPRRDSLQALGGTVSLWLGPQARSVSKGVSVYIEL